MPYKRGAPAGNTNRLKHGRHTAAAITHRKRVRQTIHSARMALLLAHLEVQGADSASYPCVDKSRQFHYIYDGTIGVAR